MLFVKLQHSGSGAPTVPIIHIHGTSDDVIDYHNALWGGGTDGDVAQWAGSTGPNHAYFMYGSGGKETKVKYYYNPGGSYAGGSLQDYVHCNASVIRACA